MSPSITSTRRPSPVKFCASAIAVVVLPSSGSDEVSMITCGGWSMFDISTEVRRLRTDSAAIEVGLSTK